MFVCMLLIYYLLFMAWFLEFHLFLNISKFSKKLMKDLGCIFLNNHIQLRDCFRFPLIDFDLCSTPKLQSKKFKSGLLNTTLNEFADFFFYILRISIKDYQTCQSYLSLAMRELLDIFKNYEV